MEIVNQALGKLSFQHKTLTEKVRFNLPKDIAYSQVYALLLHSYRLEVARRGGIMTDDSHTLDKIERTAKWLKNGAKTSLMLYGSVGNGKTTIAKAVMAVLKQFKPQEQRFCITTASTLIRIKYDANFAATFLVCDYNTYLTCDILLLDELGMENETIKHYGNEDTPIEDLLFYRYEHNKPTIITSNLDNKRMLERYGERIMDRMKEQYDKINYTNPSYRL